MDKEEINRKIFEEAAAHSINKEPLVIESKVDDVDYQREEMIKKMEGILEENRNEHWDRLAKAMDTVFAERMFNELQVLSGREFIRTYMKLLEYFRPKITRVEGNLKTTEENILRIEIIDDAKQLKEPTIDITHKEDGKENLQIGE